MIAHPPQLRQVPFYGILDAGYVDSTQWEAKCRALLKGGAGVIQVRAKKQNQNQRRSLLQRALPLCADALIPLVVNDDVELARDFPGVGLHLGQDDCSVLEAREALGPKVLIGLSTHSREQVDGAMHLAKTLSYFAVGPIFATATKPDYRPVGLELIRYARDCHPPIPWFCIGGITRKNLDSVKAAGAPGVVAVSEVLLASDTAAAVAEFVGS